MWPRPWPMEWLTEWERPKLPGRVLACRVELQHWPYGELTNSVQLFVSSSLRLLYLLIPHPPLLPGLADPERVTRTMDSFGGAVDARTTPPERKYPCQVEYTVLWQHMRLQGSCVVSEYNKVVSTDGPMWFTHRMVEYAMAHDLRAALGEVIVLLLGASTEGDVM